MNDFLNKVIGDLEGKKEWKALEARAKALPEDYRMVYEEIKSYVWHGGTGVMDPSAMFSRMIDLFEKSAADGKHVSEVVGSDVAAFVDGLADNGKTYIDETREKLNKSIADKLKK